MSATSVVIGTIINPQPTFQRIVYQFIRGLEHPEFYFMNSDGSGQTYIPDYGGGGFDIRTDPALSPNAGRIAFASKKSTDYDIYTMGIDGKFVVRLTTWGGNRQPKWSPDGQHIAFVHADPGTRGLYIKNADGS